MRQSISIATEQQAFVGLDLHSSVSAVSFRNTLLIYRLLLIRDKYVVPQLKQKAIETIVQTCWQMDDFLVIIAAFFFR